MGFDYSSIGDYTNQANKYRRDIIMACRNVGYNIPTDEQRQYVGENVIKITEIPNWLYTDIYPFVKTIRTSCYQVGPSLKLLTPDLSVEWGDGSISVASAVESNILVHNYDTPGNYTIKYKTARVDKVSDSVFYGDKDIMSVRMSPATTSINDYAFYYASNLQNINCSENINTIGQYAFYHTKLEKFSVPENVKFISSGAFYDCNSLTALIITSNSKLKAIGHHAFTIPSGWYTLSINIPSSCVFYNSSFPVSVGVETYRYSNPFNCSNTIKAQIVNSRYYCVDQRNAVFCKDSDGNPRELIHIPAKSNYFKNGMLPDTVTMIRGYSMGCYNESISETDQQEIMKIGQNVEYIHPQFLNETDYTNVMLSVDQRNRFYGMGEYGEIYTWSTLSNVGDTSKIDVVFNIKPMANGILTMPDYFSSKVDYKKGSISPIGTGWSRRDVQIFAKAYINKTMPEVMFTRKPSEGFYYKNETQKCDKFSIYNKALYRKISSSDYASLVAIPREVQEVTLHQNCYNLEQGSFSDAEKITHVDISNIRGNIATKTFYGCKNLSSIQFGNYVKNIDGSEIFLNCSSLKTIVIGKDEGSQLTSFTASRFIDTSLTQFNDLVIYSPSISTDIDSTFCTGSSGDKTLYIQIWKKDENGRYTQEHTDTYNVFYDYGINTKQRNIYNGFLMKDISSWNGL